jgi:hypothetical protein
MSFQYSSRQILEIVKAVKCVRENQPLDFKGSGERGKKLDVNLDLMDGPLVNLRLSITAGRFDDPATYRAALILEDQRIRGVDYSYIEHRRFYKTVIPKGWHQNVIDPNRPTRDANQHLPLHHFIPTDLKDFLKRVGTLWHIELNLDEVLL